MPTDPIQFALDLADRVETLAVQATNDIADGRLADADATTADLVVAAFRLRRATLTALFPATTDAQDGTTP